MGCAAYRGADYLGTLESQAASAIAGPWLSLSPTNTPRLIAIATAFRRYRYRRLTFHLIGRSASTQRGVIGFATMIDDSNNADGSIITESSVKNLQGCLVLKGWESGRHVVDVEAQGLKWYTPDDLEGEHHTPGFTYYSLPQTTANGDLAWDVYVEYDVEFDLAVLPEANVPKMSKVLPKEGTSSLTDQIRDLEEKLRRIKDGVTGVQ